MYNGIRNGAPAPLLPAIALAVATAVAGVLFVGLLTGLGAGLLCYAALRLPRAWMVLRWLAVASFGLAASYVVAKQFANSFAGMRSWAFSLKLSLAAS